MRSRRYILPLHLVLNGFHHDGRPSLPIITVILSVASLQAILVFLGSYIDGTWYLPGVGDGLLEHYGVWAILITDPLLLISTSFAYHQFLIAMETLPLSNKAANSSIFQRIIHPHVEFLKLEDRAIFVYILLLVIGFLSWTNNILQVHDPIQYFGNDVFDSLEYKWGFIANRINLFSSWIIVYPIVGFMLVSMSFSTWMILAKLEIRDIINPNVLHPDGCYGFAALGTLNVSLLLPYLMSFSVIYMLMVTHEETYASIVIPLLGLLFYSLL